MLKMTASPYRFVVAGAVALAVTAGGSAYGADIKMWTLTNENYPEFIQEAITAFKEVRPDINVVHEDFPNEAYKTTIQVALVGSEPPDVFFNWAGEDSARLIRDGLALDITEYANADGGFGKTLSPGWLASFTYDGKLYGMPTDAVSKFLYYNRSFFAEHNLSPPETFAGLLQVCRDIRAIDPAMVPWPLGNSERWKLNHVITMLNERMLGTDALAADYALTASEDELFTNPGYVEAWQRVLDLQEADCFQEAPNATSPEATRSMFAAEVSPMIYCGSWCVNIFFSEDFDDFAMVRFPVIEGGKGDPNSNFLVPQGLQVSSKSKDPEAAVAWMSFLASPEMMAKFAEYMKAIPSNPENIDQIPDTSEQYRWMVEDIASISYGVNVLDVLLEAAVANAYLDAGVEILNGTKTPQEAMDYIRGVALESKAKM